MGVLDDAIREHLDLKRRRGADPAEVERAEREALGPVRRGPEEPVLVSPEDGLGGPYDALPPPFEDDDAGWDQLAHDAAQGHEPAEFDDQLVYEDEYPEPAAPPGPADFPEPEHHAIPGLPASADDPPERRVPGALEFTDAHDAPPNPEAGRPPLPHQAPPGPIEEPAVSQPTGETVEYDIERAMRDEPARPPAADEDMLEETPEFLQDTPDHDRLWFEQRPPKDFDFGG